jgi:ATP-dependent helicase HepA
MVTGAIDMVLGMGTGAAGFGLLKGTGNTGILLEVIFVLETSGKEGVYVDRFLPNTPLRVIVNHLSEEVTESYPIGLLNKQLVPGQFDDLIGNERFVDEIFPEMLKTAEEIADQMKNKEIDQGLQYMNQILDHEIGRLAYLYKRNRAIRSDEIKTALQQRTELTELITNARIRIDAILLIREGGD